MSEIYSRTQSVYLSDIWIDETGDACIVENISWMDEEGYNNITIRVLTGSCKDGIYHEDEFNFYDEKANLGYTEEIRDRFYFNCLVFRPMTGYKNDKAIDTLSEEQSGIKI